MKNSQFIRKDLVVPILTSAIGGFLALWLLVQYQQPQIVCYTDESYQKIQGFSVATIFIVNEGKQPETNLSLSIGEKISPSDINVAYLSTKPTISNEGNSTQILIPKLKPRESAEIVFKSSGISDTFKLGVISSDSGNIRYEDWEKPWWSFTKLQAIIILLFATVAFGIGYSIANRNPAIRHPASRRKKIKNWKNLI